VCYQSYWCIFGMKSFDRMTGWTGSKTATLDPRSNHVHHVILSKFLEAALQVAHFIWFRLGRLRNYCGMDSAPCSVRRAKCHGTRMRSKTKTAPRIARAITANIIKDAHKSGVSNRAVA
jgi:hypothetical protein